MHLSAVARSSRTNLLCSRRSATVGALIAEAARMVPYNKSGRVLTVTHRVVPTLVLKDETSPVVSGVTAA